MTREFFALNGLDIDIRISDEGGLIRDRCCDHTSSEPAAMFCKLKTSK
jgi:hypothetical protein